MSLKQVYLTLALAFLTATITTCQKNANPGAGGPGITPGITTPAPVSENVRVARLAATAGLSVRTISQITVTVRPQADQATAEKKILRTVAEGLLSVETDLAAGQFDAARTLDKIRAGILTLKSLSGQGIVGPGDTLARERFHEWLDVGVLILGELERVIELRQSAKDAPDNSALRSDAEAKTRSAGTISQLVVILSGAATRYFTYRDWSNVNDLHKAATDELTSAIRVLTP